jgi:hypothetical protein
MHCRPLQGWHLSAVPTLRPAPRGSLSGVNRSTAAGRTTAIAHRPSIGLEEIKIHSFEDDFSPKPIFY